MKRSESKDEINGEPLKKLCDADKRIADASKELAQAIAAKDKIMNEMLKDVALKEHALEADRKVFEQSIQHVNDTLVSARIKLDVGGRIFSVTPEMMQRFPLSYFGALFSGRWGDKKTEDGAYFINRSGRLFDHIVDFLRDGELSVALSEEDHDALYKEADYYQLREHMVLTKPLPLVVSERWEWFEGLKPGIYNISYEYSHGTIGCNKGVSEWVIRLEGDSNDIRIGIAYMTAPSYTTFNFMDAYRLSCNTGELWNPTKMTWISYARAIGTGSQVSIRLDMDKHELTFGVNGTWFSTISGIAQETWHPCVGLIKNATVTIIQ